MMSFVILSVTMLTVLILNVIVFSPFAECLEAMAGGGGSSLTFFFLFCLGQ
jgi:membrane protein involved in colicin uptake